MGTGMHTEKKTVDICSLWLHPSHSTPSSGGGKTSTAGAETLCWSGDAQEQELPNPGDNPVWVTREGGI